MSVPQFPSASRFLLFKGKPHNAPYAIADIGAKGGMVEYCYFYSTGRPEDCNSVPRKRFFETVLKAGKYHSTAWGHRIPVWNEPSAVKRFVCDMFLDMQGGDAWDAHSLGFWDDAACTRPGVQQRPSDAKMVRAWNTKGGVVKAARSLKMPPDELWQRHYDLEKLGHVLRTHKYKYVAPRRGKAKKPYAAGGMPSWLEPWLGRAPDRVIAESMDPPRAPTTVTEWRNARGIEKYSGRRRPKEWRINFKTGEGYLDVPVFWAAAGLEGNLAGPAPRRWRGLR